MDKSLFQLILVHHSPLVKEFRAGTLRGQELKQIMKDFYNAHRMLDHPISIINLEKFQPKACPQANLGGDSLNEGCLFWNVPSQCQAGIKLAIWAYMTINTYLLCICYITSVKGFECEGLISINNLSEEKLAFKLRYET